MATLTEFKPNHYHYFRDEFGNIQGESKSWYDNGQLCEHCFYMDGRKHGEYKSWYSNGKDYNHTIFVNGIDLQLDVSLITPKDKFILSLKYGDLQWLK